MKRKQSTEPDLYVNPKRLTEKEMQELGEFIKEHKRKQQAKKSKNKKST